MTTPTVQASEHHPEFDVIFQQENPTSYKTELLDGRAYISDEHTRQVFDRLILPKTAQLVAQRAADGNKIRVTDLGCCFGNTTLALVYGMTMEQLRENWKNSEVCEKIDFQRRFPCVITGIDISENALKYCKRTGIMDETITGNLNTETGCTTAKLAIRGSDILICSAVLCYMNLSSVDYLVRQFAAGVGEGYMIVNFLNPFDLEKTDEMKKIILKNLDFVGSTAAQHRTLTAKEKSDYPDFGGWVLMETWTLKRRPGTVVTGSPPASTVDCADVKFDLTPEEVETLSRRQGLKYKTVSMDKTKSVKQVLLAAATQLSVLDSLSGPKCLIRLGHYPIICHVLSQLYHAGVERAVILCGFQGHKIKEIVERDLDQDTKDKLKIEYVHAEEESWHRGTAYSLLDAEHCFNKDDKLLVCMADHIFDPEIISNMMSVTFSESFASSEEAFALVEPDFKNMVGKSSAFVRLQRSQDKEASATVSAISRVVTEKDADAVDAGLFACDCTIFQKLKYLVKEQAFFTLADAMNIYATHGALKAVKTDGKMWFAVETKEALAFAVSSGLKEIGTVPADENWLSDGAFDQDGNRIPIVLSGKGNDLQPGGSKWETFTVERWRSAVYINLSYFAQLYDETINFITEIAKNIKLRGERVSLIEVGCGTGEFIRPIAEHFRLAIGLDFNQAFIDFCIDNIPKGKEDKMKFVAGDACQLMDIMRDTQPKHIWSDTRIVACVGNTIGIIPNNLKKRVYEQMAELAGENGVVVVVYWNARCFGDACQNFYYANPQLCGPFAGDSIHFATTTLTTPAPANYRSHWTGVEEAREVLRSLNLEEIIVEERGKGVLVAARVNVRSD